MLFLGAAALILGAMGIIFAFSGDKAMLKVLIGREKRALAGALGILGVIVSLALLFVVFYYSIFPNLLLSMHPDYVMVHQIWPRSPAQVLIDCDWFFHPAAFGRADFNPNDAVEFWDMTNRQDWHVCELSQQGIASRAYRPGPYSPRETIPAAWDRHYLRALGR